MPCPPLKSDVVRHGEVFTRRWVVETILDWVGYSPEEDLASRRLIEPACGQGAFLSVVVQRLSQSCRAHGRDIVDATDAILAYDLLAEHVATSQGMVRDVLTADGWPIESAEQLAKRWVRQGDFLLEGPKRPIAHYVVGNPPYVRLEDVPAARAGRYRTACSTMVGRADLYVGFYEVGLRSLRPGGVLGFICADRWMRNQYGRELRTMIENSYSMEACITMHDVDAFDEAVSAYPAITIIARKQQGPAVVGEASQGYGPTDAAELRAWAASTEAAVIQSAQFRAAQLPAWFRGEGSWPTGSPARLALIEQLNERFRPLEDDLTGTRVGIGVATGADAIFITTDRDLVEADRLLPLVLVRDLAEGVLDWSEHYLVNPWTEGGRLVDLATRPRLRAYLHRHEAALRRRHVGRRRPDSWYRTIDKVDYDLIDRPKLLIPDMKTIAHPVLDPGGHYPHHNLYYVVSDQWDLKVLGGLLMSAVAEAFITAYAVRMRGGTLRFQAQYLRRIRVPEPDDIQDSDRRALAEAFEARDRDAATAAALRVYGLSELPD